MAARLNQRLAQQTRDSIQTSMLINRLQDHIADPEKTPMSPTQLQAAQTLLRKALPDLTATEATITDNRPSTMSDADLEAVIAGSDNVERLESTDPMPDPKEDENVA